MKTVKNKNEEFRRMFVVDPQITSFKKGESVTSFNIPKKHIYNITNYQTEENGTIIKDRPERAYFEEVAYTLLNNLKSSQIHPFLNYHYKHAANKTKFVDFIKNDVWDFMNPRREKNTRKESVIDQWEPEPFEGLNSELAGLFAYYLELGKHLKGTRAEIAEQASIKLNHNFKKDTILGRLNRLHSKNVSDIKTPKNINAITPYLEMYKEAYNIAIKDSESIEWI